MRLGFDLADDVVLIALAAYEGNESYPTVEFAVYPENFPAGDPGGFVTDEGSFDKLRVRKFFPGSGCGIIAEDGRIQYTDPGLRGFVGRPITVSHTTGGDVVLVAWREGIRDFRRDELKVYLGKLLGLRLAFTGSAHLAPQDFRIAL